MKKLGLILSFFFIWHYQIFSFQDLKQRSEERMFIKFLKSHDGVIDISVKGDRGRPEDGQVIVGYLQSDDYNDMYDNFMKSKVKGLK